MSYPKPMPKDPIQAKIVMKLCYQFTREHFRLADMLEEDNFYDHTNYIKAKMRAIEFHLERYFPLALRIACRSMVADYRNDFDKYKNGRWVDHQVIEKYGRSIGAWQRGKRVRDLLNGANIPF